MEHSLESFNVISEIEGFKLPENSLYIGKLTPKALDNLKKKYTKTIDEMKKEAEDQGHKYSITIAPEEKPKRERVMSHGSSKKIDKIPLRILCNEIASKSNNIVDMSNDTLETMLLINSSPNQAVDNDLSENPNLYLHQEFVRAKWKWNLLIYLEMINVNLDEPAGTKICWKVPNSNEICVLSKTLKIEEGTVAVMRDTGFFHSRPLNIKAVKPDQPITRFLLRAYSGLKEKPEPDNIVEDDIYMAEMRNLNNPHEGGNRKTRKKSKARKSEKKSKARKSKKKSKAKKGSQKK